MLFSKLSLFYFVYFALLGVMAPYMGLYLEAEGFNLLEIGQLASLLMMTKIIAPNIWGFLADRFQHRLLLVRVGGFMTLLCFVFFFLAETFWQYAFVIVCFSFFWNAVLPQFEVITLFNLGDYKSRYGRIRLWGSIGFIIAVVCSGWLFEKHGVDLFAVVLLIVMFLIWLASLFNFKEPKKVHKKEQAESFFQQLVRPPVIIFFVVCFLLQLSHGAYYTYFSIFLESEGYSKTHIGIFWSVGVIAEVILFIYMHKWIESHSLKWIICVALMLTALRWYLIGGYVDILWLLLIAQTLHALSFGAMHAASIDFVHRFFAENNQGRAQALYSSVGFGLGGAVGAYLSGFIVRNGDYSSAFYISAFVATLALCLMMTQDLEKIKPEIG